MAFVLEPLNFPLKEDEHGVLRVANSRIPVDILVCAYRNGATTEDIALDYPSLKLADIHAALSFYLSNPDAIDTYIVQQETLSTQKYNDVLQRSPQSDLRQRLRAHLEWGC